MAYGVYGIFFAPNYVYIGSTIANFNTRHRIHLKALRGGKHDNTRMQELYNKGVKPEFVHIEESENKDEVRELEQYYLEEYERKGYIILNETPALVEGNPLGQIVKEKISKSRRSGRGGRKAISTYKEETHDRSEYLRKLHEQRIKEGW